MMALGRSSAMTPGILDRRVRVGAIAAAPAGSALVVVPVLDRIVGEPQREAATLNQGAIILTPVVYLVAPLLAHA